MHQPIDTTADGCAFTLRVGYDGKCYVENCGTGGGAFSCHNNFRNIPSLNKLAQ